MNCLKSKLTLIVVIMSAMSALSLKAQSPKAKINASTQCNTLNLLDSTHTINPFWVEFGVIVDFGDNTPRYEVGEDCSTSHSYSKTGTYTLMVIVAFTNTMDNSLSQDTFIKDITVTCLNNSSILKKAQPLARLGVYPNPCNGVLMLNNKGDATLPVRIFDLKGSLIASHELEGNAITAINTENWAKGIYIIVPEKGESIKLIVE